MPTDSSSDLVPVELSLQFTLMNAGSEVSSGEVLDFLAERLPIRRVYARRLPPPGVPMAHGGADWMVILGTGASIVTIGKALVAAYDRFIKPIASKRRQKTTGILVEFRNSAGEFSLWRVDSKNRDEALEALPESIRVVGKRDAEGKESIEAVIERSPAWVRDETRE